MIDISSLVGLDAHRQAEADLKASLVELDAEAAGKTFTPEQREAFETATQDLATVQTAIEELEVREAAVAAALNAPEQAKDRKLEGAFNAPNIHKSVDNMFDLAAYRQKVGDIAELPAAYRDGAMRVIEKATFPTQDAAKAQAAVAKLLTPSTHREMGAVARRVIATGSPEYMAAWSAYVSGGREAVPARLQAALQTYTDADGGYAIPFTIDPTFINTSDGSVNPLREISRVESITTKAWQGVTTEGVTAAYAAETDNASDSAPSDVAGPTATPVRAHSFVKFTAEYNEDYGPAALAAELGSLIQTAKDDLEADKFVLGDGSGEPEGLVAAIITDTTSIVPTATSDTFVLADIDKLIGSLPARFRARARMMANLAILQLLAAFGTAGMPGNSIYDPVTKMLRGYPIHESSAMDDTVADAKEILAIGDFRHFIIVDRVGMATEYIPQVFNGDGNPLGQRGVYARWRNTSKVLAFNAFRLLKVA